MTFDDNRLASALFGQYGQNLASIERRLGVVADSRGNQSRSPRAPRPFRSSPSGAPAGSRSSRWEFCSPSLPGAA